MNVGVILAGGVGVRMGLEIPKQFVPIAGRTSLEHTVDAFHGCDFIDEIIVMIDAGSLERAEQLLPRSRYPKISAIITGGATRNDTSRRALRQIGDPDAKVIFHDAVRPLIDVAIIRNCVDALDGYEAVDTGIPSADTIVQVDEDDILVAVPPRSSLRRGQTPQAFRHRTISRAYEIAAQDPDFAATDDCTVVHRYLPDVPILVVPGHEANIKITHPIDIHLADRLFQLKLQTPSSAESPAALRGAVVVVFGGGSGIGAEMVRQLEAAGALVVSHSRTETGVFVEDRGSVRTALGRAAERYGRIDHVVLTAGVLTIGELIDLTDEQLQHDVGVNLLAPLIIAQEAHPHLARSNGSLLLFSSSSYTRGRARYTVYSATKAAVVNLTQALADEWSDDGIRVNCVSPSRTATPMRERAFGVEKEGSLVQSEAVAEASVSVLNSSSTGQVFDVRLPGTDPFGTSGVETP
ncbi:MAG: bcs1 [Microbacteriaceae bacterium]|jgi:2-C-methyl-D-erythritol 4-phosphate cytidylyltransferase|nr:bcs1 [Microbacteriaceae bacterium]